MLTKTYEVGFETGVIIERIRVLTEVIEIIHTLPDGNLAQAILEHFKTKINVPFNPQDFGDPSILPSIRPHFTKNSFHKEVED